MATAIGNARLAESTRTMADRLQAISELASRLNRLQDVEGIAQAIVAGTRHAHRARHDPRLPGRPRDRDVRADRLPGRRSWASPTPIRRSSGSRSATGLTGWVAAHGETGPARRRDGGSADARRPVDRWAGVDAPRPDAVRRHRPRRHRRLEGRSRPVRCRRRDDPDDLRRLCRPGAGQRHQHGAAAPPAGRARAPARGPATPARGQRAAAVDARAGRRARPHRRFAAGDRAVRLADHLPGRPVRRRPPRGHRPRPVRRPDPRPREPARHRDQRLGDRPRRGRPGQRGAPPPALGPGPGHAVRARGDDRRPADRQRRRPSAPSTSAGWARARRPSARTSSS